MILIAHNLAIVYPFSIHDEAILEKIGAPKSSVKLPAPNGGGYEGTLGVIHQLHCLVCTCKMAKTSLLGITILIEAIRIEIALAECISRLL